MKFETLAIRLQNAATQEREHSTALYPTSSFVFEDAEQMRSLFADEEPGNIYSRFTNPNVRELEVKMAALEGTEDALALASGMAAVFYSMIGLMQSGDHIISSRAVFGATLTTYQHYFPKFGIEVSLVDPNDTASWEKVLKPNTKMLFLETPSNPSLDIVDLAKARRYCDQHSLLLNVDNCFATPYLQQPVRYGADLITHSATKYIDGQGRVIGGIIAGKKELIDPIRKMARSTGPALSPFNAWILSKSLETLAVRMDRHCDHAEKLTSFLKHHPHVASVRYPFDDAHPMMQVAKEQMKRGGGLVTFEIKGGLEAGKKFLDGLKMISLTANLGDTRTIATHPASTTHAKVTPEARLESGITDGMIRISVGLEHIDDIIADINQALSSSMP